MVPQDRKYTKEHEWVKVEQDGQARVGITAFAVDQLGDVVFFELPQVGGQVEQFKKLGEVESVKAVSDLFSPISGEVVEVNQAVLDSPEIINEDSWEKGWLLVLRLKDQGELDGLLSPQDYEEYTAGGE